MTQAQWNAMTPAQKDATRDTSSLHPVLRDYRGQRVEVLYYGERKRFQIGQTTGWIPATLGLYNRRARGSSDILTKDNCQFVRVIR